ncbi:MAG: WavE lipopolysaccharide synthesis family protein [Hafnia sp.]|uniref:WavE lipopolysaccharide synthesis family protein n=1 Tax=Hafnia sp. TaxID=1873498 RepID=UPI002FCA6C7B
MKTLTIVFQGPTGEPGMLSPEVRDNILQTRRFFPDAEMIVSSWRMTSVADEALQRAMDAIQVRLILSDDPGVIIGSDEAGEYRCNVNRLLCSSRAGLVAATRPLAVKIRTDSRLNGRELECAINRYVVQRGGPERHPHYQIFRDRVINASWFARDARGSLPFLYHPGDILLAGRTEDLRLFFSAPLAGAELFQPSSIPGVWIPWRYVPEQWLWVHAIRNVSGRTVYQGGLRYTEQELHDSECYFLNNFVPFSPRQLKLRWPKYWRCYPLRGLFSTMTFSRWSQLHAWYQHGQRGAPYRMPDRMLTALWRAGYILRVKLLKKTIVRRLMIRLFSHHR